MTPEKRLNVPRTINFLSFETQFKMDLARKAFKMTMGQFITRLIDQCWLDYEEKESKILSKLSAKEKNKIHMKLTERFYDYKRPPKE